MKQLRTITFILVAISIASSCSSLSPYKVPILQGNIFEEEDIEKLEKGLNKEQVQFIFGTALIKDPFRQSRWDYFNSIQIGEQIITESKLTVFFDKNNLVESWIIEKSSEEN
tara:strand:- start:3159 stop:3494 length:336 start_codon:yes stop_codon:yes gene_type:complete